MTDLLKWWHKTVKIDRNDQDPLQQLKIKLKKKGVTDDNHEPKFYKYRQFELSN